MGGGADEWADKRRSSHPNPGEERGEESGEGRQGRAAALREPAQGHTRGLVVEAEFEFKPRTAAPRVLEAAAQMCLFSLLGSAARA